MQILSTKRVRVIETGHECVINASDFDASVHEEVKVEAKAEKVAKVEAKAEKVAKAQAK